MESSTPQRTCGMKAVLLSPLALSHPVTVSRTLLTSANSVRRERIGITGECRSLSQKCVFMLSIQSIEPPISRCTFHCFLNCSF